ncbi:copper resistance protein B [Marinobacter apostichopi]|uniref:copper resistance protein B n=1 Tax=Marinobacter apostichopi TaxID=3035454 RepID=UPI002573F7CB|nr:copper resistance protein B [Marinobacter sp. LA51]
MSRGISLIALVVLGWGLMPTVTSAQEQIEDTTARKMPLKVWGAQFEEFEYRYSDDDEELGVWNGDVFYGTDELKVRWLTKGEYAIDEQAYEQLENQLVGQMPISDFFDAKAGVRFDTPEGPDRTYAVVGITGLAPQWFEIDANLYVSEEGDSSAELDAEYELLLTNRLILAAAVDATVAFSEDREIGVGKGLVSTETGLRLSYDLVDRSFSPYIGVVHERKYGDSEDFARAEGDGAESWYAVLGARLSF